ncbi:hypothetical protein SAMN00808754_2557 [Thermanaeromonas toyohensis ToBE]|uniref:HNH endonuclease n=1 Tax=Thermanaeromonas toyohensis ToBE TaxID=698762 RepID=A0A1W1VZN4_9FIRM|nr:hypothetical protein [Thermanaeromonas toyohensis]SMB98808.1 hypothetical protein SAMN00808754_2557 [Thermanaeromonas toyohensis ToBE]
MSRRRKVYGKCHICGIVGKLTFEHIPPRSAFNDHPTVLYRVFDLLNVGPDDEVKSKGQPMPKGMGGYTLCPRCNNNTGAWYGKAFADWCRQGFQLLSKAGGKPTLYYPFWIFPLRVLKQIITMFFSVNNPDFAERNSELVSFVLNPKRKYINLEKYRIFVYLNPEGRWARIGGFQGKLNFLTKTIYIFSEIKFPPFGYVMTIDNYSPPDLRLYDITYFSRYDYNEFRDVYLKLPLLPTYSWFPGDYRTKKEIIQQREEHL